MRSFCERRRESRKRREAISKIRSIRLNAPSLLSHPAPYAPTSAHTQATFFLLSCFVFQLTFYFLDCLQWGNSSNLTGIPQFFVAVVEWKEEENLAFVFSLLSFRRACQYPSTTMGHCTQSLLCLFNMSQAVGGCRVESTHATKFVLSN